MAKRKIAAGSTGITIPISVIDVTSPSGAGLAGILFNTAGLVAEYRRQGQSSTTAITLQTATLGTWTSGGFIADGTRGDYELGIPDAALAAGARWVVVRLYGVTSMLDCKVEIELDAVNYQDAVRFGLTSLPNAVANAANGLHTVGTGTGQINPSGGKVPATVAAGDVAADAITASALAASAVTEIQTGLAVPGSPMTLDLTQPLANVKTATVGGALHGSWISAFGKMVRDATAKTLTLFGINATAVQVHDLDDGTNPTTRTPE